MATSSNGKRVSTLRSKGESPMKNFGMVVPKSINLNEHSEFKSLMLGETPHDDPAEHFLQIFQRTDILSRQKTLLRIIKACDPYDMKFLNFNITRFHRNFLKLLDKKIVYRILKFLHPQNFATISNVCQSWNQLMSDEKTWFALYKSIGLESLASVFYIKNGTAKENSKRFYSYGNWANGIFTSRQFQAHSLGILCMAYDGKLIATGSSDRTLKIFTLGGQCIRTYIGHEEAVSSIQFDDDIVVSGIMI
jgi:WD40 repeat protein